MDLEADYLVVGSGAVGMAVADVLVHETDHTVVVVDRRHAPGGHWNDAYPFVRLHQPSATYGVNSRDLGGDTRDNDPLNVGMCERATSSSILAYYEALMQEFLASGRVRYFPMHDYAGDYGRNHRIKSFLDGGVRDLQVREKTVDTSYSDTAVPATHAPRYEVAEGLTCIPPNGLMRVRRPPSRYVVIGAGKTGIDVCLWLVENRVPPDRISWIMPRDPWLQNRANLQPGPEFFEASFGSFAGQAEIAASAETIGDLFARLAETGQLLRLDPAVTPTMYHGATVSPAELGALRRIGDVVRLGRVRRIGPTEIALERGTVPADPDQLYIDCSARGVPRRPAVPVFSGAKITPQMVRALQPVFSAALIAHVEVSIEDEDEKNGYCTPIPMADAADDWLRLMIANLANQDRWRRNPDLREWISRSRLDRFSEQARTVAPDQQAKLELLHRYGAAAKAAPANLERLLARQNPDGRRGV